VSLAGARSVQTSGASVQRTLRAAPKCSPLLMIEWTKYHQSPGTDLSLRSWDADHVKVFANADAAETWSEETDPEGVAFEYEVWE
jgi:hypothetical protein